MYSSFIFSFYFSNAVDIDLFGLWAFFDIHIYIQEIAALIPMLKISCFCGSSLDFSDAEIHNLRWKLLKVNVFLSFIS